MLPLDRIPVETRRLALGLTALFAVIAALGAANLRGQTSSQCGNAIVNAGEECDSGPSNGLGPDCTVNCTNVRCGDGIVTRSVGEECDSGTGATTQSCGRVCGQPTCDANGANCAGGCKWKIVACTGTGSSASSKVSSSASSLAAESGSSVPATATGSSSSSKVPPPSSLPGSSLPGSSATALSSSSRPVASSVASSPRPSSAPAATVSSALSSASIRSATGGVVPASSAASSIERFQAVCGDGWIHAPEACDDGNLLEGDGCTAKCAKGPHVLPHCGDGEFQEPEQCDDGARNSNVEKDACRTNCREHFCGDGVKDSDETCDDGNANDRDGCTWRCELSYCGNGVIESVEECDIGEKNSDSAPNTCRSVCRKPWCGDGVTDAGEECDDANAEDRDGCLATCVIQCPAGSTKIQGRCIMLRAAAEPCGVLCQAGEVWDGFVTWVFSFFE